MAAVAVRALAAVMVVGALNLGFEACVSDSCACQYPAEDGSAAPLPSNVTVQDSPPTPPSVPAGLDAVAGRLSNLVDFHDSDFSGSWYEPGDGRMHVGVATPNGRALLRTRGVLPDQRVAVERADRSLVAGLHFADAYVKRSSFRHAIVGWGARPQGDGIELFVQGDHLTAEQLVELGRLPVRVDITLGQHRAVLD